MVGPLPEGTLPQKGLCLSIGKQPFLALFHPISLTYCAIDLSHYFVNRCTKFVKNGSRIQDLSPAPAPRPLGGSRGVSENSGAGVIAFV